MTETTQVQNGQRVGWGLPGGVSYQGIVKAVSQNGRVVFVEITYPKGIKPKMTTLDTENITEVTNA